MVKKLREFKKGGIYWVQLDLGNFPQKVWKTTVDDIKDMGRQLGIGLIITDRKISFIDAPKGYKICKVKSKKKEM